MRPFTRAARPTPPAFAVSPLLQLPFELRMQILDHVLPSTVKSIKAASGVVWLRGHTRILEVNRQLYEECAERIYGHNTFQINITYDSIKFRYQWHLRSGIEPTWDYPFIEHFSARNVRRIKKYAINIEHPDSYMGMVKYNCGGRGLTAGLKAQVKKLVDVISTAGELHRLEVYLHEGASYAGPGTLRSRRLRVDRRDLAVMQTVLDPLQKIQGARRISVTGAVTPEYVSALVATLSDTVARAY